MEERIIFREMLFELKEKADLQGGRVTRDEVESFFAHAGLDSSQLDMICDYLLEQSIRVEGYENSKIPAPEKENEKNGSSSGDVKEEDFASESLKLYLDEISGTSLPGSRQLKDLFDAAASGDTSACDELVRLFLPSVCSMAGEYEGDAITPEDLIGEGNIGLLLAVRSLEPQESLAAYQALLLNRLSDHMQGVIRQHTRNDEGTRGTIGKVRHLHDAIGKLTQELEHTVSIDELSAYLEVPCEEIAALLNLTGGEEDFGISPETPRKPWEI